MQFLGAVGTLLKSLVIETASGVWSIGLAKLNEGIAAIGAGISKIWDNTLAGLADVARWIGDVSVEVGKRVGNVFIGIFNAFLKSLTQLINSALPAWMNPATAPSVSPMATKPFSSIANPNVNPSAGVGAAMSGAAADAAKKTAEAKKALSTAIDKVFATFGEKIKGLREATAAGRRFGLAWMVMVPGPTS